MRLGDRVVAVDGTPLHGRSLKEAIGKPADTHTLVLVRGYAPAAAAGIALRYRLELALHAPLVVPAGMRAEYLRSA